VKNSLKTKKSVVSLVKLFVSLAVDAKRRELNNGRRDYYIAERRTYLMAAKFVAREGGLI
jgi:hypothetical protein